MADQLRRDALGATAATGSRRRTSTGWRPSGVTFANATCDNPICTPSRASILTGKPVSGHGVRRVHDVLPDDETLFVERLRREAGYRTALVGKLHVSGRVAEERRRHPNDGFEVYDWCLDPTVGLDSRFNAYAAWLRRPRPRLPRRAPPQRARRAAPSRGAAHEHLGGGAHHRAPGRGRRPAVLLPDEPLRPARPLRRPPGRGARADRPVAHPAARPRAGGPGQRRSASAPAPTSAGSTDFTDADIREIRLGYAASVAFADRQIGRVLDALDASGRAAETLVIFLSDHGDQLGDHGLLVKGAPLYEPTVGIPLIVRWPARLAAGGRSPALVQGRDVAATCLAAAGLDPAASSRTPRIWWRWRPPGARAAAPRSAPTATRGSAEGGAPWEPPMVTTMARDAATSSSLAPRATARARALRPRGRPARADDLAGRADHAAVERALTQEIAAFLLAETALAPSRAAPATPGPGQLIRNRLRQGVNP